MELNLQKVGKVFPSHNGQPPRPVLENLDLSVGSGEFVSLVGASGCGKTTLLEIIAGLQKRTSGRILIDGRDLEQCRANRAIVFQQYGLFPWLTVRRNVEYGPRIRGIKRKERRRISREFIDLVGLTGFEDHWPHELSGGMQQRVALARALANSPDILLLDEPFAALDAQTKETCQQELLELWARTGVTVVFVTHDIAEAVFLSDRVFIMSSHPGRIKANMDVDLARPRNNALRLEASFHEKQAFVRSHLIHAQ